MMHTSHTAVGLSKHK